MAVYKTKNRAINLNNVQTIECQSNLLENKIVFRMIHREVSVMFDSKEKMKNTFDDICKLMERQ